MSRRYPTDPDISTVHLGQYTREHANAIAGELEEAGIVWWYKEPGWLSSLWEMPTAIARLRRTCFS